MTSIWYEVLPVTLVSGHVTFIQQLREEKVAPWLLENLPHVHPNEVVVNHLLDFFGDACDLNQAIVHSTSWRYQQEQDRLLLTYLVVLPQGDRVARWQAAQRIALSPVEATAMVHGTHLLPPQEIEQMHVLAHALDHLALLSTYDSAIQAVLEPAWYAFLNMRATRTAGSIR